MNIQVWWPMIRQESRDWLIANNGDAVRDDIAEEVLRVSGATTGSYLSDEDVEWVEAVANGERP